jgi:hypothetical protein
LRHLGPDNAGVLQQYSNRQIQQDQQHTIMKRLQWRAGLRGVAGSSLHLVNAQAGAQGNASGHASESAPALHTTVRL